MKIKFGFLAALVAVIGLTLTACQLPGGTGGTKTEAKTEGTGEEVTDGGDTTGQDLVIWVGSESTVFYEEVMAEYVAAYKTKNGKDFPANIVVQGVDTGSAAATFLADPDAGADLFTVAHDNLGKLLEGSGQIAAFENEDLILQMEEQNPRAFLQVCYLQGGDGSAAKYYGAPYISQALVLYYNKEAFAGKEDKLASWEGILEVATAQGKKATAYTGTDGYNYSHWLLAQPFSADAKAAFGDTGSLKLYYNGVQTECYGLGDDQVAIQKYAQRFTVAANGRNGELTTTDGYDKELQLGKAITAIGGAWNSGAIEAALGEGNVGVVELPTFTLTEADAYGTATAGMTFHSGSFADCKAFVKKKASPYAALLDDIVLFLTSDAIQTRSFAECDNLPASKNVDLGDDALAAAQVAQASYGIAQPFGVKAAFNTCYYSQGAPAIYQAIHQNTESAYSTDAEIVKALQTINHIWCTGKNPVDDAALEAFVAGLNPAK